MSRSFGYKDNNLNEDLYLSLSWIKHSKDFDNVFKDFSKISIEGNSLSPKAFEVRSKAFWAYSFDLLQVRALGRNEWGYRSFRRGDFKGKRVGYKPFKWTHDNLLDLGFIEKRNGFNDRKGGSGYSTRVRPTPAFLEFMLKHGITPSNFRPHFELADSFNGVVVDPIRVRASKAGDWWKPQKGKRLPIDPKNPTVTSLIAQVQRLNEWFAGHRLEHPTIPGPMHSGFYRLFNQGDRDDFAYNLGGRLYNLGAYQRIEKETRPALTINGEPVVEVDVAGSHLTLLHAMLGADLHPAVDPYDIPGIPREIVKKFVVMSIGAGGFPTRWSPVFAKEYENDKGAKLHIDHPLKLVREAVIERLPTLAQLPNSGINWAHLQYQESLGLIGAVERLAHKHGVPAYPLHDSVIVPASKRELAVQVMKEAFKHHARTNINVSVKGN